jgi:hypothetical protein
MRSKKTSILLVVVMIATVFTVVVSGSVAGNGDSWWDEQWQYRTDITITENSGSSLIDYQVSVRANTAILISQGKMKADGGDIRFTDSGGTEMSYWIESGINTADTSIWVKVPSIPASSTTVIYMYYGNPLASSTSNGDLVFLLFDDFNDNVFDTKKWNLVTGSASESGGILQLNQFTEVQSTGAIDGQSLVVETRKQRIGSYEAFTFFDSTTSNDFVRFCDSNYWTDRGNRLTIGGTNFGPTQIIASGTSTGDYRVYQLSVDGTYASLQRGVTLDSLGEHVSLTFGSSFDNFNYKIRLISYQPWGNVRGNWDWIRIREYASQDPTVNHPPVADAGSDQTVLVDEYVYVNGADSYDIIGGGIISYDWDFGDTTSGSGAAAIHKYSTVGTYTTTLTVTDVDGASDTDTVLITVLSPEEATQDLITYIENLELDDGIETSFVSKLQNAIRSIINDRPSAIGQLGH